MVISGGQLPEGNISKRMDWESRSEKDIKEIHDSQSFSTSVSTYPGVNK